MAAVRQAQAEIDTTAVESLSTTLSLPMTHRQPPFSVWPTVDADLIIVGSRGLGRASQVVLGSVSTKVAHASAVDFLVIHQRS